ncbi:MAG: aminotransferase class V-fold PLP-dependent enzyme [Bacteroidetes bacterium]|nr:aminotransferase class V-fold PLP-dependent enzyme [Bacteroidota bacterium]
MQHFRSDFLLNPEITFLNFGSFGACPKPVFEAYQNFQLELEREPVEFIMSTGVTHLQKSREALAAYVGCDNHDLVFIPNPTFAINIVARSIKLQAGDEVLATDLEYGAMDRTWNYYCREKGAKYIRQHISLPLVSKEQFIADFWKGYSSKTKAIFINHITSSTALIFPIKEICAEAKKRGLLTIIDGAHVPGHIPLNLNDIEADIYTGACHKWMMTPKGSSFLYVKKEFQKWMEPLVISWGYESTNPSDSQFFDYHQFNGTRDFSAYLCIPAAIDYMKKNNWHQVAANCRQLAQSNYQRFCDLLESQPLAPTTDEFIGQICSIPIKTSNPVALKNKLFHDYKIEVPVMPHDDKIYLRYSINAFNSQNDLDKLYDVMKELKATGL